MQNQHAKIFILDNIDPETAAMLQAYYSRSAVSIEQRCKELGIQLTNEYVPSKVKDALKTYYINYGHGSIGKQGVTYIFFENVSMLAAKAIQAHPLYAGQETSSRYINFTNQPQFAPTKYAQKAYKELLSFIDEARPVVAEHVRNTYPWDADGEADKALYERAVSARTFDILRGFLPAGSLTNVSWTTSLQNARDFLRMLLDHPLREVQELAAATLELLYKKYPSAFKVDDCISDNDVNEFLNQYVLNYEQGMASLQTHDYLIELEVSPNAVIYDQMKELELAPRNIPHFWHSFATVRAQFALDFGSWRDLQRHQRGYCSSPELVFPDRSDTYVDNDTGMHSWYLNQLPHDVLIKALVLLHNLQALWHDSVQDHGTYDSQYMVPLGVVVPVSINYSLLQFKYVAELRSKPTVHPTLRQIITLLTDQMIEQEGTSKCNVEINIDRTPDGLCLIRGNQTITVAATGKQID